MANQLILHDDYEAFAKYVGIEYEDFVNLQLGLEDVDDEDVIELEVPSLF